MNRKKAILIALFLFTISIVPFYIILVRSKKGEAELSNLTQMINQKSPIIVRQPAVAGTFYPQDPNELDHKIESLIAGINPIEVEGRLKILLVPHAGIEYSGAVAASGFKQIEGKDYTKIILLGISHRQGLDHAAVFSEGAWKTPLGEVLVEENLANKLLDEQGIIKDISAHQNEHSLEVELIFLQKVLKNFKIVPILLGQPSDNLINLLAEKISSNLDSETLLVVSSDLSHYPNWETANKVDKETINSILSGKKEIFEKTLQKLENQHYSNLDTCACGENAIKVGLKVAEILKITNFKKIKYENSGDVTGEKDRVVGYAAIGGWNTQVTLDSESQKEALAIARQTIQEYLSSGKIPVITPQNNALLSPLGAFVTLRKDDELRGCIGIFEPTEPIYQVIQKMAIAAATKDTRFSPVLTDELKDITIEISVMAPKQKITDWKEIKLGKHGVVVQRGLQSGTFLPQVATETGWNLEEFLSQLCSQKAGLPPDCYKDPATTLYTFEAQVFEER